MATWYLPITATLTQPLLITVPAGDPNSAATALAIPGAAVRGSVARAVETDRQQLDELVLNTAVRYLWLYPIIGSHVGRPASRSWRAVEQPTADDVSYLDLAALPDHAWPKPAKAKAPSFVARSGSKWVGHTPTTSARFHNTRDADRGAAWKDKVTDETVGAFFAYEAIAVGERFGGSVAIDAPERALAEQLARRITEALGERGWFGRSRRRGYGGACQLTYGELIERPPGADPVETFPADTVVCITAVSPYVGRNSLTGQIDPAAFSHDLLEALGQPSSPVTRFLQMARASGYNRAWRSDLPDTPSLAAGSTISVKLTSPVTIEQVERLVHDGIGERRIDGFGRVSIAIAERGEFKINRPRVVAAQLIDANEETLAAVERITLRRLQLTRAGTAAKVADEATHVPSPSLIARLRTQLRTETPLQSLDELLRELADPGQPRRPATRSLDLCRIEGETGMHWLREAASPADSDLFRAKVSKEIAESGHRKLTERFPTLIDRIMEHHGTTLEAERIDRVLALLQQRVRRERR